MLQTSGSDISLFNELNPCHTLQEQYNDYRLHPSNSYYAITMSHMQSKVSF